MNKAVTLTILVALLVVFSACTSNDSKELSNDEIALFEKKLANGATPKEACDELDVLCNSTGFGCKAHAAFCNVPTKTYICQQLAAACIDYPAACDVYNDHCKTTPVPDAGVKDSKIPPVQDSNTDTSEPVKDAGPLPADFMKMDVSMPADAAEIRDSHPMPVDTSTTSDM